MKQIYLSFILSIIFSSTLFAQAKKITNAGQTLNNAINKQELLTTKEKVNVTSLLQTTPQYAKNTTGALQNKKTFNFLKTSAVKAPAADLQVIYPIPFGSYLLGLDYEFRGYLPIIVAPALRDIEFLPFSTDPENVSVKWAMNNGAIDLSEHVDEEGTFTFQSLPNYTSYIPELTGKLGTATATYSYGAIDEDGKPVTGNRALVTSIPDILPLTNANIWEGGLYGGWTTEQYFGSGAQYEGKAQTGAMSLFQKPLAPLYVKDIDIMIANPAEASVVNSIPKGKSLTINVYTLNSEGAIEALIATTTVTKDNVIAVEDAPHLGFIHASFDEVDDIGIVTPKTFLLNKSFIVEVTGYDSSYSFRIPISGNLLGLGSAYSVYGDEIIPFGFSSDPESNVCDMYIQLNGAYNCLEFEQGEDKLTVDAEGGYATFYFEGNEQTAAGNYYGGVLYTSHPANDLTIDTPDWLIVSDINTKDYADYSIVYVTVTGDALPANLTGRADNITISSEGISTKIKVKQGDADWVGISSVTENNPLTKSIRQGDTFLLHYPQGTSSVAVYSITGQKIAEQPLNANGNTSISTEKWAKGVYILKFTGTNETIKVIK
ncbi:hypothetical protein AGMMS50262_00620 [Bacteroidia bacterium]|nr:hypothetical protein AGMMS50262_00620 [Bacteroidia bacterium]